MKPRMILLITSIIFLVFGLGQIFIGRSGISVFDNSLNTEAGLNILVPMQEIFGASAIYVSILLFLSRNVDFEASKRILLGSGIGIIAFLLVGSKHLFIDDLVNPPIISLGVFALISIISIYTYFKAEEN
mgnify:FL=1|tara:strand:+ start:1218 stop:1607 length:390 start_codon:yes stop_codon:yes gene_type:complete